MEVNIAIKNPFDPNLGTNAKESIIAPIISKIKVRNITIFIKLDESNILSDDIDSLASCILFNPSFLPIAILKKVVSVTIPKPPI